MIRAKPPDVVSDGKVVALQPVMLTVLQAGLFCSCSASLLNSKRASDTERLKHGEPIVGPAWVKLGFGIRYRVADLESWLARTSEPCGVMTSRRRGKPSDVSNDSEPPA